MSNRNNILLKFTLIILMAVMLLFGVTSEWENDLGSLNIENYYVLIASLLVTVIGMTATGYIFLSETIRKIKENNEEYSSVADTYRKKVYSLLRSTMILCIILVVASVYVMFSADDNLEGGGVTSVILRFLVLVLFVLTMGVASYAILSMMDVTGHLEREAKKHIDEQKEVFLNTHPTISLDSEECRELIWEVPAGYEEFDITFRNEVDSEDKVVWAKRNTRYYEVKGERGETEDKAIGFMNMWESQGQDALKVFRDVEKILCKISDVPEGPISDLDRRRMESALDLNRGYRHESGMTDDLIDRYYDLRMYRDCYIIYQHSKDVIHQGDSGNGHDFPHPGRPVAKDDIKDDVNNPRDECFLYPASNYHLTVNDPEDEMDEYLEAISGQVFTLRYEVLKKLSNKDISGMALVGFDFSNANLRSTNLSSSSLNGASFFKADLTNAVLDSCELSDADFRLSRCGSISLDGSILSGILTSGIYLVGARMSRVRILDTIFNDCPINDSSMVSSIIRGCKYIQCNLSGSNAERMHMTGTLVSNSLFSDTNFTKSTLSESVLEYDNFTGSIFDGSILSNNTIVGDYFMNSSMKDVVMMSSYIDMSDFSNSQMSGVNFTGTRMFGVSFRAAVLNNADFTNVFIGSKVQERFKKRVTMTRAIQALQDDARQSVTGANLRTHTGDGRADGNMIAEMAKMSVMDYASLQDTVFIEADLSVVSMVYTLMKNVAMRRTSLSYIRMENTIFSDLLMADCTLSDCNIDHASFRFAVMIGVRFSGCSMSSCDMVDVGIHDVTIENCDLSGTVFQRCKLNRLWLIDSRGLDSNMFDNITCEGMDIHLEGCRGPGGLQIPDGAYRSKKEIEKVMGVV